MAASRAEYGRQQEGQTHRPGPRIFPSKGMSLLTRELPGEDSGGQNPPKLAFQQLAAPT